MAGPFKLLPVLLLALFTFSVSGDLIASINCGESDIKVDTNLITWLPDNTLISNGVARVVQSSNSISPVLDTLRVFTTRKKNCYTYPVKEGQKLLVRASFYYGNYDRLSSPPTFDLHFDGNFWATVRTSLTGLTLHETIFAAQRDVVSVCVAQTKPNQFPFMSALEIRGVDSDVYSDVDDSRALFLISRLSYGASQILRYPNDAYDRIWIPATAGTKKVTSEAIFIDSTGPNNPPSGILKNAVTVESTSDSLLLATVFPTDTPVYVNMYFSEVSNLDSTQTRSFSIYETSTGGSDPIQQPIEPPYGSMVVRDLNDYTVDSITNISLVATVDSDLPPLINAIEAFNISEVLTDGTDSNDVEALALLQKTFNVLGEWSGDPCLPAPYSWDWLNCSDDATPRVTALYKLSQILYGFVLVISYMLVTKGILVILYGNLMCRYLDSLDLSGAFPEISSMDALEIIDLHNNSLTGTIPGYLGTMSNLQQLNLADNKFSGSIPTTLSENDNLKLNVTGNPSMCKSGKSCSSSPGTVNSSPGSTTITKNKKSSSLPLVLGTTIPAFFLVWVVAGVFIILRKKRKPANMNMPNVTGGKENGQFGGVANGDSNGLHRIGEDMENVVPQTMGSPSPLLDNSGQTSDLYGHTEEHNP